MSMADVKHGTLTWLIGVFCCVVFISTAGNLSAGESVDNQTFHQLVRCWITTNNHDSCKSDKPIPIYSDSLCRNQFGTIPPGKVVNCQALSDGGKWLIIHSDTTGWIDNEFLMTLSPRCPDCEYDELFKQVENTVIAIYASSYVDPYGCAALTAWHKESRSSSLDLIALLMDAIEVGQYSTPIVKGIASLDTNRSVILLSSEGGDESELWGTFAYYLFNDGSFTKLAERTYNCSVDQDYKILNADVTVDGSGHPVAVFYLSSFSVDYSGGDEGESILLGVDTTYINLEE